VGRPPRWSETKKACMSIDDFLEFEASTALESGMNHNKVTAWKIGMDCALELSGYLCL